MRKEDFSPGRSPLFSEESEELPYFGLAHDGFDAPTPLVDTFCREFFYYKLFHTLMESNTYRDENWVRGIFLLVPHEEQEAPTYSIDGLMVQPCGMKISPLPFDVYMKRQMHLFDVFIMHGYEWKFHLSQFGRTSSIMLRYCTRTKIVDEEFHVWWESLKKCSAWHGEI